MKQLTPDLLQLCTGSSDYDARTYCEHVQMAMDRFSIDDTERAAAFLATVAIESNRLSAVEESLYYKDPARLKAIYPRKFKNMELSRIAELYCRNHAALSELLYGGYHGRGLIQLTWEENYRLAQEALGYPYQAEPDLVKQPFHAALTSGWFWQTNGCNDVSNDIDKVTRLVNGPKMMHAAERRLQYVKNLEHLA
jgi:putative chitinase